MALRICLEMGGLPVGAMVKRMKDYALAKRTVKGRTIDDDQDFPVVAIYEREVISTRRSKGCFFCCEPAREIFVLECPRSKRYISHFTLNESGTVPRILNRANRGKAFRWTFERINGDREHGQPALIHDDAALAPSESKREEDLRFDMHTI